MLPTSHYDKVKADRAVRFIENLCHTKGKWAGTRFWLLPWQEQLIRDIFGIVKPDGNRQFRTAFVEICKKVRKSELAAAVALYLLYADNEPSAEVYGAAADRQQASIVFDVARQMVEMSPALLKRSKLMTATKRIVNYGNLLWFAKLLDTHFEGIIAHATYKISSGKIEGINQKIKTLRRHGYGYPDDEYFFLKIMDMSRKEYVRNQPSHKICD